jgi:hypothetical protein
MVRFEWIALILYRSLGSLQVGLIVHVETVTIPLLIVSLHCLREVNVVNRTQGYSVVVVVVVL